MNRISPEMLHCFTSPGNCADLTERQTARFNWHHNHRNYSSHSFRAPIQASQITNSLIGGSETELGDMVLGSVKPDLGLENGWSELGKFGSGLELNPSISRTSSGSPAMIEAKNRESILSEKSLSPVGRESLKKRKTYTKIVCVEDNKEKRIKVCVEEEESNVTDQIPTKNNSAPTTAIRETSAESSKENSKVSEIQKPDYIHLRARRGQATDSHSLAERARREKISERMNYLQDLVPGCNKITGKAGMLDEIINYVQSLQKQVEFLSMKLAAVNPCLDFNLSVDDILPKEADSGRVGIQSEHNSPAYFNFDPSQQMSSYCGLEMGTDPSSGLRRSINAPVSIPGNFLESTCFQPFSAWDGDFQSLFNVGFDQGRAEAFPSHPFQNLKMEF